MPIARRLTGSRPIAGTARRWPVSVGLAVALGLGSPATAMQPAPAPAAAAPAPSADDLVVLNTYGINFGMAHVPSVEVSLFLGRALIRQQTPATPWLALGMQNTVSFGRADGGFGLDTDNSDRRGLVTYRPHVTVHGLAGERRRLVYSGGLGPVFYLAKQWYDTPGPAPGVGLEVEGRIGVVFTRAATSRIAGILGVQARVSGVFTGSPHVQPLPQFGAFLGFTRVPWAVATGQQRPAPTSDGRTLLITGGVTLGASVPLLALGSFFLVAAAFSEEHDTVGQRASLPLLALGAASLVTGIVTLAVGGHRRRMWNAHQRELNAPPAGR